MGEKSSAVREGGVAWEQETGILRQQGMGGAREEEFPEEWNAGISRNVFAIRTMKERKQLKSEKRRKKVRHRE